MSPQRSWKPCADRTPCSPSTRAANSPRLPSSALSSSPRLPAAGTSPSWISQGPWNLDLIKSAWRTSASWRAPPPPASSTRSSVTGTSGNAGSALRLLRNGSCYRCTCARRTLTGNPTSRRSQGVCACETHCLLLSPPPATPGGKSWNQRSGKLRVTWGTSLALLCRRAAWTGAAERNLLSLSKELCLGLEGGKIEGANLWIS